MRVDIRTLSLVAVLGVGLLAAGCSKDGGSAGSAKSDIPAPGTTMTPQQIEQMRQQRMPPAGMGGGRPPMGAPAGAPGAPTTR